MTARLLDVAHRGVGDVLDPGRAHGPLAALLRPARRDWEFVDEPDLVCPPAARPYVLSLVAESASPLLVVTPRSVDAEVVADGLAAFLGAERVAVFPAWETFPHERLSPQPRIVGRRLQVLDRLVHAEANDEPLLAVVAPVRAVLQPMDPYLADRRPLVVDGDTDGFDTLVDTLGALGYSRVAQVDARGQFAVRGGIVDVFPAAADHAARIEFFGDDVDALRAFGVGDQRSTGALERVTIPPARELVVDERLRGRARDAMRRWPELGSELERLAQGQTFEGVESLAIMLAERPALLTDFLPTGAGVALIDPILLAQRADRLVEEAAVLAETAWPVGGAGNTTEAAAGASADPAGGFVTPDELLERGPSRVWRLSPFGTDGPAASGGQRIETSVWESFRGDIPAVAERLRGLLRDGARVVISADAPGPARRIVDVLGEAGVPAVVAETVTAEPTAGRVEVVVSDLRTGFRADDLGIALLGTWDVFGPRRRRAGRRMGSRRTAADTVLQLDEGDAVVHRTHGVGRFRGIRTRSSTGADGGEVRRDYVVVEYADGDMLYVPSDQVDAISRYQGGEAPRVMSLGGAQWERAKNRVRASVRDIAAELIRLYAARMHAPGHVFGLDGEMQAELENAFAHVETADQLTVIDEIKRDMESPVPMDRLLAGDVGFGKTEVAVRATAKAVFDGHQVAVLVPTTILAQQHAETFRERFSGFPVVVEELSRFVGPIDRRRVLDGLAAGTVDVVIGTHALLARSVRWNSLGLVIVDEEQRFGVSQKERFKQLRTEVDVLSMSATPIPRTLEMAASGIRDLSVIETPPEDRQPVHTVVAPFDDAQVALAIRRELLRDGQVFYVHNQVDTIHQVAADLIEVVPDARVAVAHGQMDERELERVMVRFWEREVDVLVCTTIVESGLDVPNANTLVVERADLLGLAQLHQLRGRVGRSIERGYAYLFFPEGASMTEQAYERLRTVAEHTRLGAGLAVAARDLEIRGAGNVIGAEQSGHVAAVGFDMYAQLLTEEIADLTGEPVVVETDIRLDLPVDAHLPEGYVADDNQRLTLYRRIAAVRDATGLADVRAELNDRFGPPPPPAERLLAMAALKAALRRWRITDVAVVRGDRVRVTPVDLDASRQVRLERLHPDARWNADTHTLTLPLPTSRPPDLVGWVATTLRELFADRSR